MKTAALLLVMASVGLLASCSDRNSAVTSIKMATTTSTDNSGLLEELLPKFAAKTGIEVKVIAVGTGRAIKHGENGLLFEPGSSTGLTDCIISLIESPNRQAELGSQARKTVEQHFSLDRAADRYVALYRSLLSGSFCSE